MIKREVTLVSPYDGLNLQGTVVKPEHPRCVVIIVHGMVEHRRRYQHFMDFLASNHIATVIFDHRGHGESAPTREDLGYFNDHDAKGIIMDLKMIVDHTRQWFNHLPLMMLAHSMGTLIARVYCKTYSTSIQGLILTGSPSANGLINAAIGLTTALIKIHGDHYRSYFMQRLVFGTYAKAFSKSLSTNGWLCSDSKVVDDYDHDPYCNYIFTLDGFLNLFKLLKRTYSSKGLTHINPDLTTLFLAGAHDPCIVSIDQFNKAVKSWKRFGFYDVEKKIYPHDRHEILNEKDKADVYQDILVFIESILNRKEG